MNKLPVNSYKELVDQYKNDTGRDPDKGLVELFSKCARYNYMGVDKEYQFYNLKQRNGTGPGYWYGWNDTKMRNKL